MVHVDLELLVQLRVISPLLQYLGLLLEVRPLQFLNQGVLLGQLGVQLAHLLLPRLSLLGKQIHYLFHLLLHCLEDVHVCELFRRRPHMAQADSSRIARRRPHLRLLNAAVLHLHDGAAELTLRPVGAALGAVNVVLVEDGCECRLVATFR